ncbi:MAG: hypothetical protein JWM85_2281 [Acidimicrobiaceae bacterium]|nr:hypothetical protein [Acidimicrobiaceae bacterium]
MRATSKRSRKTAVMAIAPLALVAGGLVATVASQAPASAATAHRTKVLVKTVKNAKYGTILVTTKGFALYTYAKDSKNHSAVTGQLLAFWPAELVAKGFTPTGTSGLGVITRTNGQHQVTYHGKPLYLFVQDKTPGQVTGQGVSSFDVATVGATSTTQSTTSSSAGGGYSTGY